ncbi:MAG: hypothetical protein RIE53_12710 [Rhodothermales bacterium]
MRLLYTLFFVLFLTACAKPAEEAPEAVTDQVRLLVAHEVDDYAVWRERFNAQVDARLDAGVEDELVMQAEDNPNLVFVLLTVRDREAATAFLTDPETARSMEFAGVTGELLTELVTYGTLWPTTTETGLRLLVRHPVEDFERWMNTFKGHEQERANAGVHTMMVTQALDDPNDVMMMFSVTDPETVSDYMSSQLLRVTMRLAGVIGEPQAYFVTVAD